MAVVTKNVDFTRVFELIHYQKEKYANPNAFNHYSQGQWRGISTEELQNKINSMSCWFIANKFKVRDKVIFIPAIGSPDWMILAGRRNQVSSNLGCQ